MVVLIVTACPVGLRGHLTRWLLEISPGVFVGVLSKRVRDLLWERVQELVKDGRAIMVSPARNEQRLDFRIHRFDWEPVDIDGVKLVRRPHTGEALPSAARPRAGRSKASRYRAARRNQGGG
ncbi:type I-E CRISPR-associated endoribonuclease Cas2e [Williamsia sp. CHRR-6]|uniref:type I-E CRISPR-associated endoribonuclease Cas2e n=1 Tax=Williamsia sp. CHRR-6 TaxID=2835871 RepID=UPI001BD95DDB|nr:type I-E CRISPR-associated endoribonuclease Cas2e [Williamsia sp. CHRR-6]MBT0566989.1 type I-E CRISPR-associated endoribonuclease Cas2 [Williamsia sp. CHRR-6]